MNNVVTNAIQVLEERYAEGLVLIAKMEKCQEENKHTSIPSYSSYNITIESSKIMLTDTGIQLKDLLNDFKKFKEFGAKNKK